MRYYNEDKDLKLYAVAGTQTVLLSFDIDKNKLSGDFIGFSVERIDKNNHTSYLNGSKHFASLADNPDKKIRNTSLVQSFYWQDYIADPGETYTYIVRPMFGTALEHHQQFENSLVVTTEELHNGKHSVYFNYGVTGSQAYARNQEFGNKPISGLTGNVLKHALSILGRDLWSEGLLKFVGQAKNNSYSICGAFYEFQYEGFLKELKSAKDRGVDVQLIVSGKKEQYEDKPYSDGTVRLNNKTMISRAGLDMCIKTLRTKPNQPHNKFMVLCENGKPTQVWTGSTNITLAGIFGQSNTGHWIVDDKIAANYLQYWNGLIGDPVMSEMAKISDKIQKDEDLINLPSGTYTFFSPRDRPKNHSAKPQHLQNYANLVESAKELVCIVFPFNMDEVFNTVFNNDKEYLRLLLFETKSDAKKVDSNDTDVLVTAGAVYSGKEEDWAQEISAKMTVGAGILYVHNKFFIIDPLTSQPVVVSGSANFSSSSIWDNDENTLLIKGDQRVADIYLTEFDRLFVHFWPRYLDSVVPKDINNPQGFSKPLDETGTWFNVYFDKTKYKEKRKQLFINMSGAKKG
jgi:phosphatidylserine/phosphatidylglycerophosphate/cardiolipin synthase-like enzyme